MRMQKFIKSLAVAVIVVGLLLASSLSVSAATQEWSYTLPNGVSGLGVSADGAGGVAIVYQITDPDTGSTQITVVRLDRSGKQNYLHAFSSAVQSVQIMGITAENLIYAASVPDSAIGAFDVYTVDKKNQESVVHNLFPAGTAAAKSTDGDGFFAIVPTLAGGYASVARFNLK